MSQPKIMIEQLQESKRYRVAQAGNVMVFMNNKWTRRFIDKGEYISRDGDTLYVYSVKAAACANRHIYCARGDGDYVRATLTGYKLLPCNIPLKIRSLGYRVHVRGDGGLNVGCQSITRADSIKMARAVLKANGWEVD